MHERFRVDRRNGLRAGPACSDAFVEARVFESYSSELTSWAEKAGRPLVPRDSSPFCPADDLPAVGRIHIAFPPDGARFFRDEHLAASEAIHVRVDVPTGARVVRLFVDGKTIPLKPPFEHALPLVPGEHVLSAEADGASSERVTFSVE
jgi:penicillin-binding protein 1C